MTSRLVVLRTGGVVIVSGEFDEGRCGPAERQLLLALADALQEYECTKPIRRASHRGDYATGQDLPRPASR